MTKSQTTWKELRECFYYIAADIEHGECFYEGGESLQGFLDTLDKMKELAIAYHEAVKEVNENE